MGLFRRPIKLYECTGNKEIDIFKRAGRNMGLGISLSNIHDENDVAVAVLLEELKDQNLNIKISSLFGLGLAAAGTQNEKILKELCDELQDFSYGFEFSAFISLALGLIFIWSSNESVYEELFTVLITRNEESQGKIFGNPFFVIYVLGMRLICIGK